MFYFIESTAPMYGLKHLSGLLMMLVFAATYFVPLIIYRDKLSAIQKRRILQATILTMWGLEFFKFIILLRIHGHIPLGEFPFALCSMPLYLFPFVAFGTSKFSEFLKPAAFVIGLLAGTITLLYPSNVLGDTSSWFSFTQELFPLRSFIYHTLMIMFAINMLLSRIYRPKKGDLVKALIVLVSLASVAIILNSLIPNADFFMLGMGYGSPFAFIREVSPALYTLTMLSIGLLVVILVYLPFELKKSK